MGAQSYWGPGPKTGDDLKIFRLLTACVCHLHSTQGCCLCDTFWNNTSAQEVYVRADSLLTGIHLPKVQVRAKNLANTNSLFKSPFFLSLKINFYICKNRHSAVNITVPLHHVKTIRIPSFCNSILLAFTVLC